MNNYTLRSIYFLIFITFLPSIVFSQTYGKIFTKAEADSLYGPVLDRQLIENDVLEAALKKTEKVAMFKFMNNKLTILGDERSKILNAEGYADNNEVFHMYSKSKIEELLKLGGNIATFVEYRAKVLTISNGAHTLEMSDPCPPDCD